MKLVVLTADHGIPPDGTKGAAVHLRALVAALRLAGHDVTLVTRRDPEGTLVGWRSLNASSVEGLLREYAPDAVIERYSIGHTAVLDACRKARIPYALELNSPLLLEAEQHRGRIVSQAERDAERRVLREAPLVLAVSRPLAAWASALRGNAHGVEVHPNGADLALHPRAARLDSNPPRIAFLGQARPWHGADRLVPIAADLSEQGLCFDVRIIGGGSGAQAVMAAAANAGLSALFSCTGALSEVDAARELDAATVLLAPYPPSEFFWFCPLKIVHAALAGVPVVSSDQGDIPELVGPGGFVVAPGDNAGFVRATSLLLQDPQLRAKLGGAARARALATSTWSHVAERILASLERIS